MKFRIHLKAEGRTFAACTLRPVVESTREHAKVTCERCLAAIATEHERTRPLPQIRRSA